MTLLRNTLRSLPALFRVGVAEAVAYRAEFLVWVLATTMPLIMLALWSAVARDAPVGRFDESAFIAYFLAMFIVRQLTGSWAGWEMNFEIRQGTLAMRLLRPVNPLVHYAVENLAALPMRLVVSLPVATVALFIVGTGVLPREPSIWAIWALSMLGGWIITICFNLIIGTLAFFLESSTKLLDVYQAAFYVFSGYLIPVELFPAAVRPFVDWLPFRYQVGLPVELMTGAHGLDAALSLLLRQWIFVVALLGLLVLVWRAGLKRFAAFGG
jgi:ABC-2 type transport system permease protein